MSSVNAKSTLNVVKGLAPEAVWKFFAGIASVPRPSKHEERIRAHIREAAKSHGLSVREEPIGNLIIDVPATLGCESAPITVLQAHVDMVCEKNGDTEFDFDNDGIRLVRDKDTKTGLDIVRADGTTLGADNGVGVAMALAAATSDEVAHGPLELLFTVDEEAGMGGAKALTPDSFRGRRLLNLDSEEDIALYIGCAGGCDTTIDWKLTPGPINAGSKCVRVSVTGLKGGHSGCDVHENRGSAIKLLVRSLLGANASGLQLVHINGGSKRNAIPREASAVVMLPENALDSLRTSAAAMCEAARRESFESRASIDVSPCDGTVAKNALATSDSLRVLRGLAAIPHGVLGMNPRVPGLVQTSNNLSTVATESDGDQDIRIRVGTLTRSSSDSLIDGVLSQIASVGVLAGASVETGNRYAGWEPNPDSSLLAKCRGIYVNLFDSEPNVAAIHAGLECGIIGKCVGDIEMVSFGPTIEGAHSPDERVFIESVQKSWKYLKAVLAELAKD
jgi:dipeptidase D